MAGTSGSSSKTGRRGHRQCPQFASFDVSESNQVHIVCTALRCEWRMTMSLVDLIWLAVACYALHILEEYQLDWRDWARAVIKLPVEWGDFYVVNALVIMFGIVAANLAVHWPLLALTFPALMLINATLFHILPTLRTRGRF